ncbi:spermidine coumaroyl-CoA acyltransferase [Cajanus cajan]|uniref:Taxadien-5-alpha-ol O-acetyltransferase n=1 Tax=Cajanus cajan TaxID=3821 RepID=A0A151R3P7_CAJCA|nr:spermidine coumaroyl-CoA acyltransferase [Cajanus cajan]KYP37112.1 Taxadien-5-alpha-ol O-acetyltransferase [Cajanus cajan]
MERIKISHRTLIFPSHPPFTHDHPLPLSHLDTDPNLHLTFRYLRAYVSTAATTSLDPFHVIAAALARALPHFYPLAGTLRHRQHHPRRLELWCAAAQGVPLVRAAADFTLDSVHHLDDPASPFAEHLAPDPGPEEAMEHPCALQVTVFACGGFTLGAAMHHALCDGMGGTIFFNAVAELARGAARITAEAVWERSRLLGPREAARVDSALVGEFLRLEKGALPYQQDVGNVARESFHVRNEWLDNFKSSLFQNSGSNFTVFEALGAYIWRAKVLASGVEGHEKVKFAYSINIRRLVKPSLPAGYWGNGCVPMYVELSAKDLIEKPIWETAELIKKSKSNVSDEYVRSYIDYQELHFGDGITAGREVSGFTDWRHLGHSTVDFGWGGPVTVLPLGRNLLGSLEPCFFLPYSTATPGKREGFQVLVNLREPALPAFRQHMKLFSQ